MANPTEKYDAYARTILELPGVPDGRIDLRRPLDDAARAALAAVGLDRPFAVLTAENPHGDNEEDAPSRDAERDREAVNDAQLATLVDALGAAHTPFVRVDGTAPDGSYRERCVAVMLPRDESVALARRFGQLALFWFDGQGFSLLPAEAGEPPRRLPFDGDR
ncbi:Protein of unknown function DUF3293 [Gemmatirosa kalamazoonensis]|uniref:DUF3293 domain-containing protein n=1 Tax=Gemmatirosa kalamazoonensis TaxID=861299 RepID=W0RPC8_9BACT|nr:DUF3293 domain-containing protein [Gemmatirosa kalamazoonensis]AHG91333.1 Protein of unknown function DUF3293 [Gemmatirosa kalamazoonensis]